MTSDRMVYIAHAIYWRFKYETLKNGKTPELTVIVEDELKRLMIKTTKGLIMAIARMTNGEIMGDPELHELFYPTNVEGVKAK